MEDDPLAPPAQSLQRYRKSCHWLKDDHFLKQLEKDTVDTDILDEEIINVNESEPKTCRGKVLSVLNSNPFQILLFVLVVVDAGIVAAEIFLDLRNIKGECEHSMAVASDILQETYSEDFKGYPHFDSLVQVLDVLVSHYGDDIKALNSNNSFTNVKHPCQSYCEKSKSTEHTETDDHHKRKRRDVFSTILQLLHVDELSPTAQEERTNYESLQRYKRSEIHEDHQNLGVTELSDSEEIHSDEVTDGGEGYHEGEGHGEHDGDHHGEHHSVGHILHLCSVAILSLFVIQLIVRIIAMGSHFCNEKLEVFDAVVICASFILDVVFIDGISNTEGREAAVLLVVFLIWRLIRVINGLMVTEIKRQEFRLKLQIRARTKVENKLQYVQQEIALKNKELETLKDLCRENQISEEEINSCKPTRQQIRNNKSKGQQMGLGNPLDFKKRKSTMTKSHLGIHMPKLFRRSNGDENIMSSVPLLFGLNKEKKTSQIPRTRIKLGGGQRNGVGIRGHHKLHKSSSRTSLNSTDSEAEAIYMPSVTKRLSVPNGNTEIHKSLSFSDNIQTVQYDVMDEDSENNNNKDTGSLNSRDRGDIDNATYPENSVLGETDLNKNNSDSNHLTHFQIPVIITTNIDEEDDEAASNNNDFASNNTDVNNEAEEDGLENEPLISNGNQPKVKPSRISNGTLSTSSLSSLSNNNGSAEWSHVALTID